ncbi:MAG: putative quinol monooxygenase [Chloroflexota bacterium]
MAEHAHIVRVAKYRPQPGGVDDLRTALHALAERMRGLPGLFGVQVCQLIEDPEWLALVSRWEHEEAMRATGNPGLDELMTQVAGLGQEQRVEHFAAI